MTTRPTISPLFATDATFTGGDLAGSPPRLDPGAGFRAQGAYPNRRWPARWWNFVRGLAGDWIDYLDQKTRHRYNLLNFGADPLGVTPCDAAITAALAAAGPTSGIIVVPPGSFTHINPIAHEPGINWEGVPGASFLNINHATNDQQRWGTGSSNHSLTEISGISFGALVDNTGFAINNPFGHTIRVTYRNCAWNDDASGSGPRLKGRLALIQGGDSVFDFDNCHLEALNGGDSLVLLSAPGDAQLWLRGKTRLVMPATYSGPLVEIDDGTLHAIGNIIDVTAHGGSAAIWSLSSSGPHVIRDNEYHGAFSSGATISTFTGVRVNESGSLFDVVNPYDIAGGALALGSELTLANPIASLYGGSSNFPCATGYRAQSVKFTDNFGGNGPLIILPSVLFHGQRFTLTVYNASFVPWSGTGITFSGAAVQVAPGNSTVAKYDGKLTNGWVRTFNFIALDNDGDGDPTWVLESEPSPQYPAS